MRGQTLVIAPFFLGLSKLVTAALLSLPSANLVIHNFRELTIHIERLKGKLLMYIGRTVMTNDHDKHLKSMSEVIA